MKTIIKFCSIILGLCFMAACTKDFVVKNIKNSVVDVIAPADNLATPGNAIVFWWNELDGAQTYNLQIVKPTFNAVAQLILDTNITGNKFNYTFNPGAYQWRIKGVNAGGSTAFITRTLIIDTTSNLNLVTVTQVAPLNKLVTPNNTITFSWNPTQKTNYYEIELKSQATNSITTISNITTSSYTYSFSVATGSEEAYTWKVTAYNTLTNTHTLNNTLRSFKIDHKIPFPATNISPSTYSMSIRDTVYLHWTRNLSSPDIQYDIISLSDDSTFSYALGTKTITTGSSVKINDGIYTYTNTPKAVWWTVTSVDSAGNVSPKVLSKRLMLR